MKENKNGWFFNLSNKCFLYRNAKGRVNVFFGGRIWFHIDCFLCLKARPWNNKAKKRNQPSWTSHYLWGVLLGKELFLPSRHLSLWPGVNCEWNAVVISPNPLPRSPFWSPYSSWLNLRVCTAEEIHSTNKCDPNWIKLTTFFLFFTITLKHYNQTRTHRERL